MQMLRRLAAGVDLVDLLLLVGLVSLLGGIAAFSRPAAAITFGVLCLALWIRKNGSTD